MLLSSKVICVIICLIVPIPVLAGFLGDGDQSAISSSMAVSEPRDLQTYTPSKLLQRGEWDIKLFNNLYTQTAFFDENNEKQDQNSRSTYFTGTLTVLAGFRPNINLGFDLFFKSVKNDTDDSSPFSVLSFGNAESEIYTAQSRTALTGFVPKLKIAPFSGWRGLAIQTGLFIPLADDMEGFESSRRPFLEWNGVQWWTQFLTDYRLSDDWLIYLESGHFLRFGSDSETQNPGYTTPLKAILNYYPSDRMTAYISMEFAPDWGNGITAYYGQIGLGGKYQLRPDLEIEALATTFPVGKNKGAGQTLNVGLRYVR